MKKLVISMITFMLVATAFSTATFAWISLSKTSIIDDIYLVATLGDQLEISLDGETYFKEFPKEELEKYLKTSSLNGVTTTDGIDFNFLEIDDKDTVENRDYLSFDFYFRTTSNFERHVYLANNISKEVSYLNFDKEGTFVVSRGVEFVSPVTYLYDLGQYIYEGQAKRYYAHDAFRIATIFNEEEAKIFDLSGNEHRGYGKPYGAHDYYQKVTGTILEIPEIVPSTIYQLSEFSPDSPFSYDDRSKIMELNDIEIIDGVKYYSGKVTIKLWLEGWDADLFDPILRDRIKIKLQFKAVRGIIEK